MRWKIHEFSAFNVKSSLLYNGYPTSDISLPFYEYVFAVSKALTYLYLQVNIKKMDETRPIGAFSAKIEVPTTDQLSISFA